MPMGHERTGYHDSTIVPENVDSVFEPLQPEFKQIGLRSVISGRRVSYLPIAKITENHVQTNLLGGSNGSFLSCIAQLDLDADSYQAHLDRNVIIRQLTKSNIIINSGIAVDDILRNKNLQAWLSCLHTTNQSLLP
mmetsp:Transcript_17914/g.29420  ORF Transcript_17914/g.29420 Transcript_17914/m.29420 type:complete len:136 (-) Transcript_17914:481-888(-)